jgi:hypothetical protein
MKKFLMPTRATWLVLAALVVFMLVGWSFMSVGLEGWMAPPSNPSWLYRFTTKHPSTALIGVPWLVIFSFLMAPLFPIIILLKDHAAKAGYVLYPAYIYLLSCLIARVLPAKLR